MNRSFIVLCFFYTLGVNTFAQSMGTGFFVSSDGLIATSNHVIAEATTIEINFDGKRYLAKVTAQDEANDLAILKVDGEFPFLEIKGSEEAKVGEDIFTVGFPNPVLQGYEPKMTTGVISSMTGARDDPTCYQISSPVQPGNSGGPLLSKNGDVLGIIKSKLSHRAGLSTSGSLPENVNYAVKSDYLNLLVKMARGKVKTKQTKVASDKTLQAVEKSIACIVLVIAKNEKFETTSQTNEELTVVDLNREFKWEKYLKEGTQRLRFNETIAKFNRDDPLETWDKIGPELRARGELNEDQIKFFEGWKLNTLSGGLGKIPIMLIDAEPYEKEWKAMLKFHDEYVSHKDSEEGFLEKLTYMKMMKPKIKAKGLKLLAEEFEEQWSDDSQEAQKMRESVQLCARDIAKNGGTLPQAKIIYSDSMGFLYTDPTINDDTVVSASTKKRILSLKKNFPAFVLIDNEVETQVVLVSDISNEAYIAKFPKKVRGDIVQEPPSIKRD